MKKTVIKKTGRATNKVVALTLLVSFSWCHHPTFAGEQQPPAELYADAQQPQSQEGVGNGTLSEENQPAAGGGGSGAVENAAPNSTATPVQTPVQQIQQPSEPAIEQQSSASQPKSPVSLAADAAARNPAKYVPAANQPPKTAVVTPGQTGNIDMSQLFNEAKRAMLPLSPGQIKSYKQRVDQTSKAIHPAPAPKSVSRSIMLSFQPGTQAPVLRMAPGFVSSVVFVDSTGSPWPITSNTVGNAEWFSVLRPETGDNNMLTVNALTSHVRSNVIVTLKGRDTPVVIQLAMDDAMTDDAPAIADSLLSVRMDCGGPNARQPVIGESVGSPASTELIAFLDGVPPRDARAVTPRPAMPGLWVWDYNGRYYVRTSNSVVWPARISVSHGTGGYDVYVVPTTSVLVLSENGQRKNVTLQ